MSFFGKFEKVRSPNIGMKSLPRFPGDPGIQILTEKYGAYYEQLMDKWSLSPAIYSDVDLNYMTNIVRLV